MHLNIPIVVASAGLVLLILGFLSANLIFPQLEIYLIEKETALVEGSTTFEIWKEIPFPFKLKVYFFNVTNPDEVQMGSKPDLREVGPYIYDEYIHREVLSVSEENDTIKYIQRKTYFFNEDESGCRSEDDLVTIINFAVLGMVEKVQKVSPVALVLLNDALPSLYPGIKDPFMRNSVRKILFDGITLSCESDEADLICEGLRRSQSRTIRKSENGRDFLLSLFHHMNRTEDRYEIGRGLKSTTKGEIVSFQDRSRLGMWVSDRCNAIRGTDLTNLWAIPKEITFFVSDLCRSFSLRFHAETAFEGLESYVFRSRGLFPKNDCSFGGPEGTMHMGPCTGSNVVLSQPHFLNAEPSLLGFCRGLHPDSDKHETGVIMEPKTGLVLAGGSRFQMNVFLKQEYHIAVLQNVSEGLFPFLWIENGGRAPEKLLEQLRDGFVKLKIFYILEIVMVVGGILLIVVSVIMAMVKDTIFWKCGRSNAISAEANFRIEKVTNMYEGSHNKPVWKIFE